jgi:hypothetical protein
VLERLTCAVDRVIDAELDELSDAAVRDEFVELCRELDRLEHRRARLLAAIHRRGIPDAVGALSTAKWAEQQTGLPVRDARDALHAGLACEQLPDREGVGAG